MGKKAKQLAALQAQIMASIADLKKPETNPAQQFLTDQALAGANVLKSGDFSQLPKGMFFDFSSPVEQMKQYDNTMNVGKEGTFALGDNGAAGNAFALAGDYRKNLFARTAADNYQQNVSNAATNIRGGLGQAANYKTNQDQAVIGALQGMYGAMPRPGPSFLKQLILAGVSGGSQIASSAVKGGA